MSEAPLQGLSGFREKSNGPSLMNEGLRLLDTCDRLRVEGHRGTSLIRPPPPRTLQQPYVSGTELSTLQGGQVWFEMGGLHLETDLRILRSSPCGMYFSGLPPRRK